MKRYASMIGGQPPLASRVQIVTGAIVDNQEDLAPGIFPNQSLEKRQERGGVEDFGELERELRSAQTDRRKQVGGLARAKGIDSWLATDARPGSMQRAVEPEAGFVFEQDYASAGSRFFLIAGNVCFSHSAWRSASALAKRLRGRCTENPSLWSRRGI